MAPDHAPPLCRRCNAPLAYAPGHNAEIVCRYCGERQPLALAPAPAAQAATSYQAILDAAFRAAPRAEVPTARCGHCGAETTRPAQVISDACAFCGSPALTPGGAQQRAQIGSAPPRLAPDALLPFALDEARARAAIAEWEEALWWKPGPLFAAPPRLTAVYLPYWSFDWSVSTEFAGRTAAGSGGIDKSGAFRTELRGVTVLASASVPLMLGADLEPWDLDRLAAPRPELLAGVRAETHGDREGLARGATLAHRLLDREIDAGITRALGADRGVVHVRKVTYEGVAFRLLLLPVWIARSPLEGRAQRVLVNASTGEVAGERPVSGGRVALSLAAPLVLPILAVLVAAAASRAPVAAALTALWATLAAEALLSLVVLGSGPTGGPERRGQFFLKRPDARGTESFAEIFGGLMQGHAAAKKELFRGAGVLGLVASGPALGVTLLYAADRAPLPLLILFQLWAVLVVLAAAYAWSASLREKRYLLGLEEEKP